MIKYFTIEDLLKHYLQKKFHILELRREKGVFSIQFLGGTKDYQIYSVQEDNGINLSEFLLDKDTIYTCYLQQIL